MRIACLIATAVLVVALAMAAAPKEEMKGLLAPLEKGQKVALKDAPRGYEISVMAGVDLGFTIKEIGQDYLVLEDVTGTTEIRISVYAIKSVKIIRLPK